MRASANVPVVIGGASGSCWRALLDDQPVRTPPGIFWNRVAGSEFMERRRFCPKPPSPPKPPLEAPHVERIAGLSL